MMFKFTLSSVLLLIYVTTINCSDSFSVIDTNDEYQLTERKHESNKHLEHEFSIENFRVEHGKEKSLLVIEVSYEICLVLEDVCAIMFFAIIFYNCQPKYLCALITLSNGGEALDVINDDSKKETNEDSRKE
ncbi:unnamed protein product [Diamesa serratosioi]